MRSTVRSLLAAVAATVALLLVAAACSPRDAPAGSPSSTSASSPPAGLPWAGSLPALAAPATVAPQRTRQGLAPVVSRVRTEQPVVFLTIDDGWTRDPRVPALLRELGIPASVFLLDDAARADPGWFARFQAGGSVIQDHTVTHRRMDRLSYATQKAEICSAADRYEQAYGARPTLFRPPYGAYDADTRRAAAACGMRAVVLWTAEIRRGPMLFQGPRKLRPGDIVLMHFTPGSVQAIRTFAAQVRKDRMRVGKLEDWLR